ncbi:MULTISPECIES: bifunctional diguanylate cyclase/phosphodiesterase [Comamonas]|uniref:putative bifunctional diguanylate cyclase/phosphodiesterase n=1 Tax=Comamonas TaxID=283 RepID=UPI000E2BC9B8|nr:MULTISPECIES: bifunctional diguanylate cyclase/phosphodiesterase [Comamonas]RDI10043.1 diguanylate cyclase/phosphodiesterase [Comamonas sp. AG1104]
MFTDLSTPIATTVMTSSYSTMMVCVSIVIAVFASFVTLGLARRMRMASGRIGRIWWAIGAMVMGTGVWAMHFIGMQAFELPITLGYGGALTLASWVAAVAASALAFGVATRVEYRWPHFLGASLLMGGGICAMHYLGMLAIEMSIPIAWDWPLVAASALIAVLASATALNLFRALFSLSGKRLLLFQTLAALVMGFAICGMHYTGMSAASFASGSVCLSAEALSGPELTTIIIITTVMLLIAAMFSTLLDARLQSTAFKLNQSLQETNAKLQLANTELRQRAFADPLTNLPNRLLFEDRLIHALLRLERANRSRIKERLGILFVDLDGFKPINDSFGHAAGDQILISAAERLMAEARSSDTVARVGGDEFLVLLEDTQDVAACMAVANRILKALSQPFRLGNKELQITCSIGIVAFPDHGDRDHLIANADAAMYAAKRNGGNGFAVFEPHMGSDASEQLELQNDLRHAIQRGQMELHYQPKIDSERGNIIGVEALLRWAHPERGMIAPDIFIPLAERFGIINSLGNWVIEEACHQLALWRNMGLQMRVAINLSVHQLRESGLADRITQTLARHDVQASQLLCEITESVAMEDTQATQRAIEELRDIGIFLSIDDFGTGYSSLNYLRQLPAQQLKIDRSFIRDLETEEDARAVVHAVVRLAHALGLRVVAEGVETAGQRDILIDMQCDELQGYFYARPMPADSLLAWARDDRRGGQADFSASILGALTG